jgi:DNA invertase Pin-like site-specific DNA recombinase
MAKNKAITSSLPPVAVGYARCSTGMQEHSVADQLRAIERWCADHGHELAATFVDDGVSGADLEREGLLAMLDHLERRPGGVVVLWDVARLARADDAIDGVILERRVTRAGWRLNYLHDAVRTGDAFQDGLMGFVGHHAAGQYRRTLALSTTRGAATSMAEGKSWRGPTPFAYAKLATWADGREQVIPRGLKVPTRDAACVRLVPGDAREVETLRSIFDDYASGRGGVPSIAAQLAASGAPAPGARWNTSTVQDLIANPVYCGDVVWNRHTYGGLVRFSDGQAALNAERHGRVANERESWVVVRDAHEALVPRETWERAQGVRAERGRARGGARRVDRYPLSGLLTCGSCGGPFVMKNVRRYKKGRPPSEGRQARYRCAGVDPTRPCKNYSVHEDVIEAAVRSSLGEGLGRFRSSGRLRAEVVAVLERAMARPAGPDPKLEREEHDLTTRISRTVALLPAVDAETARELAAKLPDWRARLAVVQGDRQRQEAERRPGPSPQEVADQILALVDAFDGLPTAERPTRRRFYEDVLGGVVVRHEVRTARGRPRYLPVGGELEVMGPLAALCSSGAHPATGACTSSGRRVVLGLPVEVLQLPPAEARRWVTPVQSLT